jgi:hypothetical protein
MAKLAVEKIEDTQPDNVSAAAQPMLLSGRPTSIFLQADDSEAATPTRADVVAVVNAEFTALFPPGRLITMPGNAKATHFYRPASGGGGGGLPLKLVVVNTKKDGRLRFGDVKSTYAGYHVL